MFNNCKKKIHIGKVHEECFSLGEEYNPKQGKTLKIEKPEKELNEELVNDTLTKCEKFYQGIFEEESNDNMILQNLGGNIDFCLF